MRVQNQPTIVPVALAALHREEIDSMVAQNILQKEVEPTQ